MEIEEIRELVARRKQWKEDVDTFLKESVRLAEEDASIKAAYNTLVKVVPNEDSK